MLLQLIVFYKTNGAAYLMEIIVGLLSCAVLEGDNTTDSVNADKPDGSKMER
jgi:hypothetical protein